MFCLHCGKEILDQSTFCMACGKAVGIVPTPEARPSHRSPGDEEAGNGDGWHSGRILLGLVIAAALLWILFVSRSHPNASGIPASMLRPNSQQLVANEFTIKPAQYFYQSFTISNTLVHPHVVGGFRAAGGLGNDIQVVLAEKGEFENWANGHQARLLYSSGKTTNGRMDVAITEPGRYCLGFSNAFSLLSAKTISADIELQYLTH